MNGRNLIAVRLAGSPLITVGLWSFVLSAAFIWVPGYWVDEAVTVVMAGRDWQDFLATLKVADAVHATYYVIMRVWCTVFGFGELATRIISSLAVAATSVVLVVLGELMFSRRAGIIAGVVYPLIPATAWAAGEARSFALAALASALTLLAVVRAVDQPTASRWALVALAIAFAGWLFVYTLLMVPATLLLITLEVWRHHRTRVLVSVGAGCLAVLPLVVMAARQRAQISWIPERTVIETLDSLTSAPYFREQGMFAAMVWSLLGIGAVILWVRRPRQRPPAAALALSLALPSLALAVTGPILGQSMYHPRYLVFAAPALALLLAALLAAVPRPWMAGLAIVLFAWGAVAPLQARTDPLSKSSWIFMVETVAERGEPGDIMVAFSNHTTMARVAYPDPLATLPLLNEAVDPAERPTRLATTWGGPLVDVTVPSDVRRIWYMSDGRPESPDPAADLELLGELGFAESWRGATQGAHALTIHLLERSD